jgi:hypothetical protein
MPKRWLVYVSGTLSCLALLGGTAQSMAQATGDYATDLATLYHERYALQAQKDVCISVQPKTRAELQKAYDGWRDRHEDLLEDLDARFAAMIKKASVDQKDYSRNFGKYQGAVMRQRQEQKDTLLALPRDELLRQCRELPGYLRSPKSDIPARYPDEFKSVYGKK